MFQTLQEISITQKLSKVGSPLEAQMVPIPKRLKLYMWFLASNSLLTNSKQNCHIITQITSALGVKYATKALYMPFTIVQGLKRYV